MNKQIALQKKRKENLRFGSLFVTDKLKTDRREVAKKKKESILKKAPVKKVTNPDLLQINFDEMF